MDYYMKRNERAVTDRSEIVNILKACPVCRIALPDEPAPYLVPMNFGHTLDGDTLTLYFHCAQEGRKIDLLKKCPSVGFEMDRLIKVIGKHDIACTYSCAYESVIGTGAVSFLTDHNEKRDALLSILEQLTGRNIFAFNDAMIDKTTVFRVVSKDFTVKRSHGKA